MNQGKHYFFRSRFCFYLWHVVNDFYAIYIPPFMKPVIATAEEITTGTSLQLLLNEAVSELPALMQVNKVIVENEIPSALVTQADKKAIGPVIGQLLKTVLTNARDTCITITAEKYSDVVSLHVMDRNNNNGYALSFGLLSVSRQARCMGGEIAAKNIQKRVATVSFSFPDNAGLKVYPFEACA